MPSRPAISRGILFPVIALLIIFTSAMRSCAGKGNADEKKETGAPVEKSDLTDEARAWADSVTETMDTVRLVGQLFMPAVYASDDAWTIRQVRRYAGEGIGGVVLLRGSSAQAKALADSMAAVSKIRPFIAIDAEWGLNMRLVDAPRFPANGRLSPKVEDQLMYDYGNEVARECRLLGINMVLGPVIDVGADNPFLGIRSFGGNPQRVSELGLAYGRGLHDGDVIGVAKHFPGHGTVTTDSHLGKGIISGSLQRLDTVDLVPFRHWIDAGMPGVMVGHLAVPAIDSGMLPAAVSPTVITDLLRTDLGFKGLVLTDALNMLGAKGYSALDAVKAGADIIVAPAHTDDEIAGIITAIRSGKVPLSLIREHVKRILFYKYLLSPTPEECNPLATPQADSIALRLAN